MGGRVIGGERGIREGDISKEDIENDLPVVMGGYAKGYPGFRKLRDLTHLISEHGHRTLPIELGALKSDKRLNESLMLVRNFVDKYLSKSTRHGVWSYEDSKAKEEEVAYCAQHGIFEQIRGLGLLVEAWPEAILGAKGSRGEGAR